MKKYKYFQEPIITLGGKQRSLCLTIETEVFYKNEYKVDNCLFPEIKYTDIVAYRCAFKHTDDPMSKKEAKKAIRLSTVQSQVLPVNMEDMTFNRLMFTILCDILTANEYMVTAHYRRLILKLIIKYAKLELGPDRQCNCGVHV